jgi:fatty acid desaturase
MDLLVLEADRPPTDVRAAVRTASQRDNWRNALFLAVDWLLMALAAAIHVWYGGVLLYVVIVILIGSRMRALANLLHEAAHHKLFASRRVNVLAGRVLCAWPIFISFDNYVRGHRLHHKNLWRNDDDPDVALYRLTGTETGSSDRLSYPAFLLRHVVAVVIPVMPMRRLYDRGRWRYALGGAAVWGVVLAGSWWWWPPLAAGLALYWLVPWLTAYQTISYWAELGEHGGLRNAGWVWGSRNWRGNLVSRWAVGSHSDDLYHLLHHWFPAVPHHRLRHLDRLCRETWPRYAAEARCTGFFYAGDEGTSVLRDIWSGGRAEPADGVPPGVAAGS